MLVHIGLGRIKPMINDVLIGAEVLSRQEPPRLTEQCFLWGNESLEVLFLHLFCPCQLGRIVQLLCFKIKSYICKMNKILAHY